MAFNDFRHEQECPRCGQQTLITTEGYRSRIDDTTLICPVCHDDEALYRNPWPGYPGLADAGALESATPEDSKVRHWRHAGAHGVLNHPPPDGTRESRIGIQRGPLKSSAGRYHHGAKVAPAAVTNLLFNTVAAHLGEEKTR